MIVVIPRTWPLRKDGVALDGDPEWLPRNCPRCHAWAVVGHGRRRRLAHDGQHAWIVVRRAHCRCCDLTMTILPAWASPCTHYSLSARAQAVERCFERRLPLEQCAPDTLAGTRVADPSTLRRWIQRRLVSRWCCSLHAMLLLPTIVAWDCWAAFRILFPEAQSP